MANKSGVYFDPATGKMVVPEVQAKPEGKKSTGKRNANSTWLEFPNDLIGLMKDELVKAGFNPEVNQYGEKFETEKGKMAYATSAVRQMAIGLVRAHFTPAIQKTTPKSGK